MQTNFTAGVSATCTTCRAKKIKCDGSRPKCTACRKARNAVVCDYTYIKPLQPEADLLRKGAACRPCRRKKKKCDGKRPFCQTCAAAGKKDLCEYDNNQQAKLTKILLERTQELELRLKAYEDGFVDPLSLPDIPLEIQPPQVPYVKAPSEHSEASSCSSYGFSDMSAASPSPPPAYPPSLEALDWSPPYLRAPTPIITNPTFHNNTPPLTEPDFLSCDPYLLPPPFTDDLGSSFHDSPWENFDPSSWSLPEAQGYIPPIPSYITATSALGDELQDPYLTYRCLFIHHNLQLGVNLLDSQMELLRCGDLSGVGVYPAIIDCAHLWGCVFWQRKNGVFRQEEEDVLCKVAVDSVSKEAPDLKLDLSGWLTAYNLISSYFFFRQQPYKGREFLFKASNAVLQHNLRITDCGVEGFQEIASSSGNQMAAQEATALYQFLYLDKYSEIAWKFPTVCSTQLDEDFQEALMNSRNTASHPNICPTLARTRSIAFLRSAQSLLRSWTDLNCSGPKLPTHSPWLSKYWSLIQVIHEHLGRLTPLFQESVFDGNRTCALFFEGCIIMSLTALAHLYSPLALVNKLYEQESVKHAMEAANLASNLSSDDFEYLDPALSICWSAIGDLLACHRNVSPSLPNNSIEQLLVNLKHLEQNFGEIYGPSITSS